MIPVRRRRRRVNQCCQTIHMQVLLVVWRAVLGAQPSMRCGHGPC